MANIVIEKRTRALATDVWGNWISTTDLPPYTNTATVEYRALDGYTITVDQLTDGDLVLNADDKYEWQGPGVFDVIIGAVNGNIQAQYDSGRIPQSDYAQAYLGGLQSALQTAVQFLLQKTTAEKTAELNDYQMALVERQTKGFDDDAKYKLLKVALDSWSVGYSVAQDANSIPDSIKVNVIDSIMKNAYTSVGVTKTNDPIGEA